MSGVKGSQGELGFLLACQIRLQVLCALHGCHLLSPQAPSALSSVFPFSLPAS